MADKQNRQKNHKNEQSSGCCSLILLAVLLLGGYLLLNSMDSPYIPKWTSSLEQNPYAPEDFITVNGYVTCSAGRTRRGLDVSEYQGSINWEKVRSAGFDFAFIRIGYRGYSVGNILEDDRARSNLAQARDAGFDVGVYFYAQAVSPEEASQEAQWCLDFLAGEELELPVVYDWEWVDHDARTGQMDKTTLTECARTFCNAIESGGYESMIYFNSHVAGELLDLKTLAEYPFWLAQFKDQMDYPYKVDVWQYTEEGTVPGIKGDVDIDLMFIYE